MNPLVSLIVPCWNGEKYLDSFLSCIISQSYRPLELIFIDDGSSDSTMSILERRKADIEKAGISLISESIPHQGQAAAMNAGLRHAKGEYLTWSDSDDFLLTEAIKAKADFLTENKEYGMVRNDAWHYIEKTNILSKRMNNTYDENVFDSLFRETLYCYAGCYMVRMNLFNECYPEKTIPYSKEGQKI